MKKQKSTKKQLSPEKMKSLEERIIKMPEVQAGKGIWQNAFHEFDVYEHTMDYVKHLKTLTSDPEMIVAGYFHDIGKPVVAKPKIKDGKVQEREPGKPYHEFDDHEKVGEQMVRQMNSDLFREYGLNQERIARLVGAHYLPMEGIKAMRKTEDLARFREQYKTLEDSLDNSGLTREEILSMFLADKLAQGKFCTDKDELLAIREALLGNGKYSREQIYEMQKRVYGNKA